MCIAIHHPAFAYASRVSSVHSLGTPFLFPVSGCCTPVRGVRGQTALGPGLAGDAHFIHFLSRSLSFSLSRICISFSIRSRLVFLSVFISPFFILSFFLLSLHLSFRLLTLSLGIPPPPACLLQHRRLSSLLIVRISATLCLLFPTSAFAQ